MADDLLLKINIAKNTLVLDGFNYFNKNSLSNTTNFTIQDLPPDTNHRLICIQSHRVDYKKLSQGKTLIAKTNFSMLINSLYFNTSHILVVKSATNKTLFYSYHSKIPSFLLI